VDHDHRRCWVIDLRVDDPGVNFASALGVDIDPFMMAGRRFETLRKVGRLG
jgi:hypothetical protein